MKAAKDHVEDTGPSGLTGHTGADGSSSGERMERYVTLEGMSGENHRTKTSNISLLHVQKVSIRCAHPHRPDAEHHGLTLRTMAWR